MYPLHTSTINDTSSIQKLPSRNNFHIVKMIQQSSFITQTFEGNGNQNNYSNIESHQRLSVLETNSPQLFDAHGKKDLEILKETSLMDL
jgi:hypothetical protein